MSKRKPQICFGAIHIYDRVPHVSAWTINALAHQVRAEVGDAYKEAEDETNEQGWERARKAGMRVVKIAVRII